MHKRIFTKYNHATILLFLLMHLKFVLFSSFREMERKFLRSPCFYHSFFSLVFKGSKSLSAYSYIAIYYVWWGGNYLSTSKWGYKILVLYELMFAWILEHLVRSVGFWHEVKIGWLLWSLRPILSSKIFKYPL